jgi:precorrin-2/cobalt-factor-2 C20-methyltransferase
MLADGAVELPLEYPVTTEIPFEDPRYNDLLAAFYENCVAQLVALAEAGVDVVVLCEGDPFFYGSFMHLYTRLRERVPVSVVPGITGMSAAWTATGQPVTWGDDILTVLMGTLEEATLTERIARTDALVVMKIGRNLAKLRRALARAGREDEAWLSEYAAMPQQRVMPLREAGDTAPYFSILVIHGTGRRP